MISVMLARSNPTPRFSPDDEVVPGVPFGLSGWAGSPAYWAKMAEFEEGDPEDYISPKGTPLADDLAFCLLGGYGVKMELNRAAWEHLYDAGVFAADPVPSREEIEDLLSMPLLVEGRRHKYRYPRQRADRLHVALNSIRERPPETDDPLVFRQQLMELPGIGPKTASWIVRNWLGSDEVAILDIHVLRAGTLMGLFPKDYRLPKDYEALEKKFLAFAKAIQVRASLLDAIMWREMRILFN
jgi:thermostable 8-oxoguanine DNA glycosylase